MTEDGSIHLGGHMHDDQSDPVVTLRRKEGDIIGAPVSSQRKWLVNNAVSEFKQDLKRLDEFAEKMIPGAPVANSDHLDLQRVAATVDTDTLNIGGHQVMQTWEKPLMRELARAVSGRHADVLEVGFGMGISAEYIQSFGVNSHTIVECHPDVLALARKWASGHEAARITILEGRWQDVLVADRPYDGILFDTFPLSPAEIRQDLYGGLVYSHCAKFFPLAAELLAKGGTFTYFTWEMDSLSRGHQRALLEHFSTIEVSVVSGLRPPPGCQYWWADRMVVVSATKH